MHNTVYDHEGGKDGRKLKVVAISSMLIDSFAWKSGIYTTVKCYKI
jgi:hypothetical protein